MNEGAKFGGALYFMAIDNTGSFLKIDEVS